MKKFIYILLFIPALALAELLEPQRLINRVEKMLNVGVSVAGIDS